jgi:hypothetical protein
VALSEHVAHGPAAAATFLHGYVDGLVGKAAFGLAFALAASPLGAGWALLLACVIAAALTAALAPLRRHGASLVDAAARHLTASVQIPLAIA